MREPQKRPLPPGGGLPGSSEAIEFRRPLFRSVSLEMRRDGEVGPRAETLQFFRGDLVVPNVEKKLGGTSGETFLEIFNRNLPDGPGSFLAACPGKGQEREDR